MAEQQQALRNGEIIAVIDDELQDIIPGYLENRRRDVSAVLSALERGDFELIRNIGHKMKGTGGGYGFDRITDIGRHIEEAAKIKHHEEISRQVEMLKLYLEQVKVVYQK